MKDGICVEIRCTKSDCGGHVIASIVRTSRGDVVTDGENTYSVGTLWMSFTGCDRHRDRYTLSGAPRNRPTLITWSAIEQKYEESKTYPGRVIGLPWTPQQTAATRLEYGEASTWD